MGLIEMRVQMMPDEESILGFGVMFSTVVLSILIRRLRF